MKQYFTETRLYINADWAGRKETAASVANRLDAFLRKISLLDPTLSHWDVGRTSPRMFPETWTASEFLIAADRTRAESGEIEPDGGYRIIATSRDDRQHFGFNGAAGSAYPLPFSNHIGFHTDAGVEPDYSIVTYALFRQLMLAIIECWAPAVCFARSNQLKPDFRNEGWFAKAWMTYVRPEAVAGVDLSSIPCHETTPDGGLLLTATTEIFRPTIFAHVQAAQRISRATQHLNAALPKL